MESIVSQYALALFELSNELNIQSKILSCFTEIVDSLDDEIYSFINHPKISKKDKKDVLSSVVKEDLLIRFLYVLVDNNRIYLIKDIKDEFINVINQQNNLMEVTVFSNVLLSSEKIEKIKNKLEKQYNREVVVLNIIDELIIGGLRIEYNGSILDDTVNNQLGNLKANLMQ